MTSESILIAQSDSFADMASGAQVLDALQATFSAFGAGHFLASGMPLPGRSIDPLLLRLEWGDLHGDRHTVINAGDAVLQHAFRARRAFLWIEEEHGPLEPESALLAQLGDAGKRALVLVPICAFLPYQGVVVGGGTGFDLDATAIMAVDHMCIAAFRRLFALKYLRPERQGELSGRERKVVELSATGKTAGEIAEILAISQRTVHAHLQNASEKLRALNKTHTVVEALRYGQISM
jgi:LuxR family transcriptional regulator, quorum-sensing system regulator BjaR1